MKRWGWKKPALIALAVLFVLYAASLGLPPEYKVCHPDDYTHAKACAYYHFGPGILASVVAWADIHNGLVTALGTLAIAGFTLTLWRTSERQGKLAQHSIDLARAEFLASHRPDIVISAVRLLRGNERLIPDDQPRSVRVDIINKGESIGTITGSYAELTVYDPMDLPLPSEFGNPNNLTPRRRFRVGAADHFTVTTGQDGGARIASMEELGRSLYLLGWIVYEDESEWRNTRTYFFCRKCDGEFEPFSIHPHEVTY